jgi:hypothetical protein
MRFIETLPKRGYRFIVPVKRTLQDGGEPKAAELESKPESAIAPPASRRRLMSWIAMAAAAATVFCFTGRNGRMESGTFRERFWYVPS